MTPTNRERTLSREITVTQIPSGDKQVLPSGTKIQIHQTLGGSYTVQLQGHLFRIEGKDADAIGKAPQGVPQLADDASEEEVEKAVWQQMKTCYDPEIPINIVDLGLIYDVQYDDDGNVTVKMTLTTQGCPSAQAIPEQLRARVAAIEEVRDVKVEIVWEPAWNPSMISPSGRQVLGLEV